MAGFWKISLCILLVISMLVGCKPTSNSPDNPMQKVQEKLDYYAQLGTSPDDDYRVWYEILVYSFCDSNGDGIGDLQGVISKLDYLQTLNIQGIWLLPVHPSTTYHKYNVDDYYAIDPDYGTMADFDQLVSECHKRGIKVIMDLVVNHSGDNNPWFTEALEYLENLGLGQTGYVDECKYFGYYNFVESTTNPGVGYRGLPNTIYHYECRFNGDMPDLNWDNEDLRADVKKVMEFWLNKGVDGFRIDAAKEFYTNDVLKNVEVLSWLQETAESINPDVYMVAEVWESNYTLIKEYYKSGMTSIFNYPFGSFTGKLMTVVNNRSNPGMVQTWAKALQTATTAYAEANPDFIDVSFTSNHDVGRIYDFANGDENRIKLAGAMNLFMSGCAVIYYGEELGMPGGTGDPSQRAPMYWNTSGSGGMTQPPPDCTLPSVGYPLGSFEDQKDNPTSVYNYYRQAVAIRQAIPAIARGLQSPEDALNKGCVSAIRKTWNNQDCIILLNIDQKAATCDLSGYSDWEMVASLSVDGSEIKMDGSTLNLTPFGIAVLTPKK